MARQRVSMGPDQGAGRWLYRFMSGRPLDGVRRTDSTWAHRATASTVSGVERYSWWSGLAGWQRQVVRLGVTGWVVLVLVARGLGTSSTELAERVVPAPLVALVVLAVRLAVLAALVWGVRWLVRWRMEWHVVQPLAAALRPVLGWPASMPHRRWLRVPMSIVRPPASALGQAAMWVRERWLRVWDWAQVRWARAAKLHASRQARLSRRAKVRSEIAVRALELADPESVTPRALELAEDSARQESRRRQFVVATAARVEAARVRQRAAARVRVTVPMELGVVAPEIRAAVVAHTTGKLGGEWTPAWSIQGRKPHVEFRRTIRPPEFVSYAQIAARAAFTAETELAIGLEAGNKLTAVNLDADAPHLLLSMGSGAGKSVLLRWLACQALRKGWAVVLIDFKMDHYWCQDMIDAGTPGLYYIRHVDEMHRAFIELEGIRQFRAEYSFIHRNNEDAPKPQRVLVLFEEMNITVNMMRAYWQEVKEKGDPAMSPALKAFGGLSGAGRSASMNLVAVGQYLTAQVFGGPEARENFGIRVLSRYSVAAWRTLVPEIPVPKKSTIQGRVQVCVAGERRETQVAYLEQHEVREWASGGLAGVIPPSIAPFQWSIEARSTAGVSLSHLSQLGTKPGSELSRDPRQGSGATPARDSITVIAGETVGEGAGKAGGQGEPAEGDPDGAGAAAELPDRRPLRAWFDAGMLPEWTKYDAARQARLRDTKAGIFPATDDQLYTADEMLDWKNARKARANKGKKADPQE